MRFRETGGIVGSIEFSRPKILVLVDVFRRNVELKCNLVGIFAWFNKMKKAWILAGKMQK